MMDELQQLQAEAERRMQYKPVENKTMADAMREKLKGMEQIEPNRFAESNAYKKYFSTKQDILEEAKTINKATGIPINAIIDGNVEKAREIYDYHRRQLDPEEVYKAYPGLKRLAELDENEAAIALHDLKSVKITHDVFEAAKVGRQTESLDYERRMIGVKAFEGTYTDEEKKRVAEIEKELSGLKQIPDLMEAPGQNIAGGLAQQVPMMARQLLKGQVLGVAGALAGGMIGAVGGGVLTGGSASPAFGLQGMRIGYSVGSRLGFATEMFKEAVGGYYLDYVSYKDKNGNQLLSDNEARNYATVAALVETGIEMANFGKVLEILKGNKATVPAAKVIENIVKHSKDAASVQAQLKTWLSTNMKNIGILAATESAEEGVQQMSEMGISQIARVNNPEGNIPKYNAGDILTGGFEASYQALGASIGLGGMAAGASGLRFTRHAAQLMSLGKERADEALRTNTGVNLLNGLMEAATGTELGANHKETFNKLMKSNLEGTAHETAFVDSELLLAQEGGEVVFNQLAAAAGYTEEQINTLRETGAPIEINTADVVSTLAGSTEINISEYVSFDAADRCFARNQKVAKELNNLLQKVNTQEVERTTNNINTLATEIFGETEERDLATMIIAEFEDPVAGIEERRSEINREISDMIDPVVETMRGGMGKGVTLYDTDDYGNVIDTSTHQDAHIGGKVRYSNNDAWYTRYFKENKKAPSGTELRELAEEAITGNNPYGIGDYDYTDPGMVEYAEETKARLENLRHELELLNNIEPKLKDVNKGDFAALDALSEDGVKVYKAIIDKLRSMPNKDVQRAASMGALIYAHRAETHAEAMRILGNKKFTALDYMASHPVEFGGELGKGFNQESFENNLAPNGKKSNLTPSERAIAYSEDFKNWFGDWEAAAYALVAKNAIENTESVVSLTGEEFGKSDISLVDRVVDYYKQIGKERVTNLELGEVKLDKTGVKDSLGHGIGRLKAVAYAAVPDVIEKGIVYAKEKNWKGRGYDTAVLIANIEIGNEKYVCEVVVKQGASRQGFYLHEVALKKDLEDVFKTVNDSTPSRSKLILAQYIQKGKEAFGKVDKNGEPLVSEIQRYIEEKEVTLNQSAWHGTPHNFEAFDLGAIGTGEGAAVHGWGLYFAKNKKVAKHYKEELSKRNVGTKGSLFEVDIPDNDVLLDEQKTIREQMKNVQKLIVEAIKGLSGKEQEVFFNQLLEREHFFKKPKELLEAEIALRKKKLLVYHIGTMNDKSNKLVFTKKMAEKALLENGYTKEQIEAFATDNELAEKEAAKYNDEIRELEQRRNELQGVFETQKAEAVRAAMQNPLDFLKSEHFIGESIYKSFAMALDGDYELASKHLNKHGIKGITYDGERDGRCFVVFDDKAISIINRFNQAAGQKALTANQEALQTAQQMKDAGESKEAIYDATGWYLGADGKWRFEIPDNLDKINVSEIPEAGYTVQLRDIYDNPKLYKAYPWLGDALVYITKDASGYRGLADSANNLIEIAEDLIKIDKKEILTIGDNRYIRTVGKTSWLGSREDKVLSDVELMALAELYESGMDIEATISDKEKEIASLEEQVENPPHPERTVYIERQKQGIKTGKEILEALQQFKEAGVKVESYTDKNIEDTREEFGSTLIHEIQHLIQDREGFARGGNILSVDQQIQRQAQAYEEEAKKISPYAKDYFLANRKLEQAYIVGDEKEYNLMKKVVDEYGVSETDGKKIKQLMTKYFKLVDTMLNVKLDRTERYQRLHGEQESRAASRKAKISTEIEKLEAIEVKTVDELVAEYGGNIKDQTNLARWVELYKKYNGDTEGNFTNEEFDEMDGLKEELSQDEQAVKLFEAADQNEDNRFEKLSLDARQDDYKEEVLRGVNPYIAIIVFDKKVVAGLKASQDVKGQTIVKDTGERIIKLFETADESTFIHEIGHVAYEDLKELASMENAPAQFKRDLKTLDDWANWKEGQLDEYVGSAVYKEFSARDAAIREALAKNDVATAEQLKYEWRQERFARGWEEYFKKGKAPTEGLRRVFYEFKKWLTKIYRAYRSIGGVPTKEVEAVMTRLLLTDEAIELAEKKAEIDAFEKSGVFNYLGDNAQAMWQKILEDVRKDATSKVLKVAMKDMSELAKKERQDKIDAERQAAYERMAKEPVWTVYSYLKYNPKMDTFAACKLFGLTIEEYVGLLKANGGTLERAVDNYMKAYEAELEAPKKADIEARAEEALTTSYYKTLLSAFEAEILQREVRREARLSKKIASIEARDENERAEIEKSLRELDKKGDEAKAQRALRDVAVGNVEKIRQYAKEKLALMDISYSANPVVWKNASRQKAAEMTEALAKKDYNKAVFASKMRLVYDAMADIATENKKLVDRKSKQMRDRAKTIRREKNMGANDRYVYNHLLYAFGLAERDVPKPPNFTSFNEVLISYDATLSMPFIGDNGELLVSDFIINAGTGTGKAVKGIFELTVSEFTELANVMDNIYTVAVEANKIKTVTTTEGETITVDQVIAEIMDDAFNRHKEKEVKDTTMAGNVKKMDKILDAGNRIHISLLKAETILDELSPKATKYIYDTIKRAAEKELKMNVEYGERIEQIREAWRDGKIKKYLNQGMSEQEAKKAADKEIEEAFTVERYKLGTSNITKENIIAFALNWGTEINRKRALNYPGTTTRDFERIFAEMDGADWQFVTNVWDLFEDTWPQLKAVEANVSGVTLEKQEGITFNVTDKEGFTYIIQGKYYPIKYDPKKNQKVQRQQKEEGVRTNLPSMARMGIGIGMTKERAVSTSYLMRNDLGVFAEAIQENIHLICMREAVRDASRIINDERFADIVKNTLGDNALSALQDWVLDCWQLEPKVKNDFESAMAYLRKKQTTAVLAFRLSTALLNVANIGPVMHYLGLARTKKALMDFYGHPVEQYNFVIERSPFVKNRAQTMDRDMRDVVKGKGIGDKMNKLEAMGFCMITKTDLMLACPLWLSEYQRVYRENTERLSAEQIERLAVDAGDKAVRNVFGSGMVQDLAAVQRGGEVTKMLTMYYSYFSVVQQAISKSVFERNRRKVNGDEWYKRWAPVANTIIYWLIIPSAISAIIKMSIEAATGDDDDEFTLENFIKKTGAETINAAAGGVPILRDVVNMATTYAAEGKYYGARSTSIGETTEKMMDVICSIKGYTEDKKDLDDVLRAVFRATAYTTGIPVAGADALATLYQWIEYGDATPEEIGEYLTAILLDKKVKK